MMAPSCVALVISRAHARQFQVLLLHQVADSSCCVAKYQWHIATAAPSVLLVSGTVEDCLAAAVNTVASASSTASASKLLLHCCWQHRQQRHLLLRFL
jgi:hypothetical protein